MLNSGGTKYRFGSDSRMKHNGSLEKITPGPGAYEDTFDKVARHDGKTLFGSSK